MFLRKQFPLFLSVGLVAVAMFVFGVVRDDFLLRVVSKPFPVLAVLAFVGVRRSPYARGVLGGLALCVVGDILLELGDKTFLPGMIAFGLGHVAYVVAFFGRTRRPAIHLAIPFVAWIVWALLTLWSGLGEMQIPVTVYTAAIFVMMWRAAAMVYAESEPTRWDWCALLGAALFGFSDTLIALDRFGDPIDGVRIPIIITYWLAQVLIAVSVLSPNAEE